jgi:hypothetical protein
MRRFLLVFLLIPNIAFGAECTTPITYSIESVDDRFKVSKGDLVGYLVRAESVWETPLQRNLFDYVAEGGAVSVTLKYDSRQAATDSNKATLEKLAKIKSAFELTHVEFNKIASSTEVDAARNVAKFAEYKTLETAFNADISASNARGGASPEEYTSFDLRKAKLIEMFSSLKAEESVLNDKIKRMNILSSLLNQLSAAVNGYIARYNAALQSARDYEEGIYQVKGGLRNITVFEFANTDLLMRVLAHEFGHALGIGHVQDKEAIMFERNEGQGLQTTAADIEAIKKVCSF